MTQKACRRCGTVLPLESFHRNAGMPDGRINYCKDCVWAQVKARQQADPELHEQRKAYMREWNKKNGRAPARAAAKQAAKKKYVEANRARVNAQARKHQAAARAKYPERARAYQFARKSVPFTDEAKEWARVLLNDPCVYCGAPTEHIDHIEPISRGGDSEWDNLAPACGECNRRKNAKPLLRFLLERTAA